MELKSSMIKLKIGEQRIINQNKEIINDKIEEIKINNNEKKKKVFENKVTQINKILEKEKEENKNLENLCKISLKSIYSIAPEGIDIPSISLMDIPNNLDKLQNFVNESIKIRKKNAIEEMRKDISNKIPGIDIEKGNIAEIVTKHIEERLKLKEIELEKKIKRKEYIEKKLEENLEKALNDIKQLEKTGNDTLNYMEYFEKHNKIDEIERKKFEEKMMVLGATNKNLR